MLSGLNTDVFWQLAAGNWMLDHHSVIRADVFSYTVHGRKWLAEEWGFEVLLATMVRHLGAVSYWILSGGLGAGAIFVSAARWRRQQASGLLIALLSMVAMLSLLIGDAPRPQSLSYLLFAIELYVITRARESRRWLAVLPPLLLVWANVHGSFVLGIGMLALEGLNAQLSRASAADTVAGAKTGLQWAPGIFRSGRFAARDLLATLIASTIATLVNPHGAALWPYALQVSGSTRLNFIQEWQSPDFHNPLIFLGLAVPILVLLAALATARFHTSLGDLVLCLGLLAATLHSVRFAPYFGIALCGVAASWEVLRRESIRPTVITFVAGPLLVVALLVGHHIPAGGSEPGTLPITAATFLRQQSGNVFSTYGWNDYLIARGIPVFVDGRTDLYFGTGTLSTYLDVSGLTKPPDPVFARWRVRWVLWPAHSTLSTYLLADPRWRLDRAFETGDLFEASSSK